MDIDVDKLKMISNLMEELIGDMEPGEDDLSERLGRPKPEMAAIKIEAGPDDDDMGDEMPVGDDVDMPMSEDDKLKDRLMKLRG